MDKKKLKQQLLKQTWKQTTTFKTNPHSYSLDINWEDKEMFNEVAKYIKNKGTKRLFYSRPYYYYKVGEYEYWAMKTSDGKGIINRRLISQPIEDN
jgi:hypothetical protein